MTEKTPYNPERRRHHRRTNLKDKIIFTLPDQISGYLEGTIIDQSQSGIGIATTQRLAPGQRVLLDKPPHQDLPASGVVIWSAQVDGKWRAGIMFTQ